MEEIISALREAQEEEGLPKAVRIKLDDIVTVLLGPGDERLKASKALSEIESLCDSTSLPSFVRTQLWNVANMLELV